MELSRLLRRALLVTAIAVAGWLAGVVFAGGASAETIQDSPEATPGQQQSGGLLGGLLGGVTDTLTGLTTTVVNLTGSVLDTATTVLAPVLPPAPERPADLPVLLPAPVDDSAEGSTSTDPVTEAPVEPAPSAQVAVAPTPPPAPPVTRAVEVVAVRPAEVPVPQPAPAAQEPAPANADSHADGGDPDPRPRKAPAAPGGPGSTVSSGHDTSGGARGTHGVLTTQATLHPADAGFTTRSRAVDAAGRTAGLPASSPD